MKRITIKLLLIGWFAILFSSCSIMRENNNRHKLITANQHKIEKGMLAAQVLNLLGTPCNRQFNGQDEAFQYCYSTMLDVNTVDNHYVVVLLYKGAVTGMTSYDEVSENLCTSYFRTIKWDDAPQNTIEI